MFQGIPGDPSRTTKEHIGKYPMEDLGHQFHPGYAWNLSPKIHGKGENVGPSGSARRSNQQGHALLCWLAIIIYYYHLLLPLIAG